MVLVQVGILEEPSSTYWALKAGCFAACMPIAIVGLLSAIFQAKMSVASIHMTAKQPDASGKGMTMTVLVETYAILALLVSILMVIGIPV